MSFWLRDSASVADLLDCFAQVFPDALLSVKSALSLELTKALRDGARLD